MNSQALAYLPLVSPIATLVVVMLGVFFSNRHVDVRIADLPAYIDARFSAVDSRFASMEVRFASMEARIQSEARVNEANFKLLLGKVEDIDNRLTRLEERFARG